MGKIFIVRHGATYFSKNKIPYGEKILSADILEESIPVVKKIANFLKNESIDKFYTSPLLRCIHTAQIISDTIQKDFEIDNNLSELNKETLEIFRSRVKKFIENNFKKNTNVLVVTHGAVIAAITSLIAKNSFEKQDIPNYPDPETILIVENNEIKSIAFTK